MLPPIIRSIVLRKLHVLHFFRTNLGFAVGWPLLSLVLSALLCGAMYFKLDADKKALEAEGLRDAALLSRAYAQQLSHTLEAIDQTSMAIRDLWEQSDGRFRLEKMKSTGSFAALQFGYISIFDTHGHVVSSTFAADKKISVEDRDYFKFHKNNNSDALRIGIPVLAKLMTRKVIHFTRRLARADDEFDGVIVISIAPEFFVQFSDAFNLGNSGLLGLIDADGVIQTATVGTRLETSGDAALFRVPAEAIAGPAVLLSGERWFADRKARFFSVQPLRSYPLAVGVGIGLEEKLAPYRQARDTYTALAIGAVIVLMAFGLALAYLSLRLAWRQYQAADIRESYRSATEGANEGFFLWQIIQWGKDSLLDLELVDCNERGATLYGRDKSAMIGTKLSSIYEASFLDELLKTGHLVMHNGFYEDEFEIRAGSMVKAGWLHRKFVRSGSRIAVTLRDITEKKQHEGELTRLATQDALTGLPNRHWLMNYLPNALMRAVKNNDLLAVLFIDLDNFKNVNDSAGHSAGDHLLCAVASRLKTVLRPSDHIARLGGDEFTVVLDAAKGDEEIAQIAGRIVQALQEPFFIADRPIVAGGSIGIAICPRDGTDAETVLKNADIAMYVAKEEQKGSIRFYNEQYYGRIQARLHGEQALEQAIRDDEFVMYYQPRVDTQSGELVGLEALVRWVQPGKGLISPDDFIPLAERTGLILPLGDLVMNKVCGQLAEWRKQGISVVPVSINVSARQFSEGKVNSQLSSCLARYQIASHLVEVELTESAMMGDLGVVQLEIAALNRLGIKIHVDDFGTGYSSLSLLNQLRLDVLKIDRSFTSQLGIGKDGAIFFKAIVSMAKALNMRIVAEGVETKEQLALLKGLECDEVQGYLISAPVSAERIPEMLNQASFAL